MSEDKSTKHKKKSARRNLIEWAIIITVGAGIYISGYAPEVIGTLQRGLLATGIFRPDTTPEPEDIRVAEYDLILVDMDGERVALSSFRGKTVFLNLWATWCPPCIAEMPNIQALYEEMAMDDSVAFVMLSLDEHPDKARGFIEKKGFTFPVYMQGSRRPAAYSSSTIPTTYVIDPQGRIVLEKKGMSNYHNDRFKEFLRSL